MSWLDWCVLIGTLTFIIVYGTLKTRGSQNTETFLKGDSSQAWWGIGISVMATQASAITFLSLPGQAYQDGMRFVQFYFGLPLAMVVLCIAAIPLYYKLKVYTAYELLESRFDLKTRSLTALLFLIQRGLAAGITIYAPAIVLSTLLDWPLNVTNILIGSLVIIYTVSGGVRAVNITQMQQLAVMMGGMLVAALMVIHYLPSDVSTGDAIKIAGKMGKLNIVDFNFNWDDRYNFWSGITGGFFLALSYFGTDQSQVGRYLGGKSITESRLGLLFNGLLKIPMQLLILFVGVMVFVFYQFNAPPVYFNEQLHKQALATPYADSLRWIDKQHTQVFEQKRAKVLALDAAITAKNSSETATLQAETQALVAQQKQLHDQAMGMIKKAVPDAEVKDTDYIFLHFVMSKLPQGIIGLLIAVMFCAAMSSKAAELNALASTSLIDIYKRSVRKDAPDAHYLAASRWLTVFWGILAIVFAVFASMLDNLIQAVNILGSLFYGPILGIFAVAFYVKYIRGNAVFMAAILAEAVVFWCYLNTKIAYLWFNVIGCVAVLVFGLLLEWLIRQKNPVK